MPHDPAATLARLALAVLDTRVLLGALLGWNVVAQLFGRHADDEGAAGEELQGDGRDTNAGGGGQAALEVAALEARLQLLRADNESLATEVVLLRSELSEATSPLPPARGSPGPRRAAAAAAAAEFGAEFDAASTGSAPGSATRPLRAARTPAASPQPQLLVLEDGTFRLRAPRTPPASAAALEAANARLAADNAQVRNRLEEIAPGSARGAGEGRSARALFAAAGAAAAGAAAEENARLRGENEELRAALDRLVRENDDLSDRILEVAFMTDSEALGGGEDSGGGGAGGREAPSPIGALRGAASPASSVSWAGTAGREEGVGEASGEEEEDDAGSPEGGGMQTPDSARSGGSGAEAADQASGKEGAACSRRVPLLSV